MKASRALVSQIRSLKEVDVDDNDVLAPTKYISIEEYSEDDEEITADALSIPEDTTKPYVRERMMDILLEQAEMVVSKPNVHALQTLLAEMTFLKEEPNADRVKKLYERFIKDETRIKGKPAEHIVTSSSRLEALVFLIVHYPTFLKANNEIFDAANPCV